MKVKPKEPVIKLAVRPLVLAKGVGTNKKLQSKATRSEIKAAMVFKKVRYSLPRTLLSDFAKWGRPLRIFVMILEQEDPGPISRNIRAPSLYAVSTSALKSMVLKAKPVIASDAASLVTS